MTNLIKLLVLLSLLIVSCSNAAPTGGIDADFATSDQAKFRVETVATGLEVPWGFAWMPNGDMLFTERPGRVRLLDKGKLRPDPVFVVPDVEPSSESGLMDV